VLAGRCLADIEKPSAALRLEVKKPIGLGRLCLAVRLGANVIAIAAPCY
jgi:hypothetical protein